MNVKEHYEFHLADFYTWMIGDTISHLESFEHLEQLLKDCNNVLIKNGILILSFRDYSV